MSPEWESVVADLRERSGLTTPDQLALASKLEIDLDRGEPALVSAARIRRHLAAELNEPPPLTATESRLGFLQDLSHQIDRGIPTEQDDRQITEAWIEWAKLIRSANDLESLAPVSGDVVVINGVEDEVAIVSSISSDGRVNLKGAGGSGRQPRRLTKVASDEESGKSARQLKANAEKLIALRMKPTAMSMAKSKLLEPFKIEERASADEVELLREAIESASDESPIQKVIEKHPRLMGTLDLTGHATYVRAQVPLIGKKVPDFMLATVDSAGVHWTYVELESPTKNMGNKDGSFSPKAREAINQIKDWRRLVLENLDVVRKPEKQFGTGLVDIRPNSPGLVIIGRRGHTRLADDAVRVELEEELRIRIRTYDWLLESIERPSRFSTFRDPEIAAFFEDGWL